MKYILLIVFFSISCVASATEPCAPDYKNLCTELDGNWNDGNGCYNRSCSIKLPVVEYNCLSDNDCVACGLNECRFKIAILSSVELEAIKKFNADLLNGSSDKDCAPAAGQSCACVNSFCRVKITAGGCEKDSDCFWCCGSCMPQSLQNSVDCNSFCIIKNTTNKVCQCVNNQCR